MISKDDISMSVIRRLPRYYRYLGELENSGISRVSSKELSDRMGFTASQIRQDFNCFGGFGQQGYGYVVPQLKEKIGAILGVSEKKKCILVGAGNLGRALMSISFDKLGFEMVGVFDNNPEVIGSTIKEHKVLEYSGIAEFCKKSQPVMAIICTPGSAVEDICDKLCGCGIKGFWNFSHYDISIKHPEVYVETVHLNDSLMTMCYMLNS